MLLLGKNTETNLHVERVLFLLIYTVLTKIIGPPHQINVYEKFYFPRKSISPLIYSTI